MRSSQIQGSIYRMFTAFIGRYDRVREREKGDSRISARILNETPIEMLLPSTKIEVSANKK